MQVCHIPGFDIDTVANVLQGSGCIAALEAEKFLSEQEDTVEPPLQKTKDTQRSQTNYIVPEYRSNPLL